MAVTAISRRLREQERIATIARLEQLDIRLNQLPDESAARAARLKAQLIDLDAREAELAGRTAYAVKAPISGRVTSISAAAIGQTVVPQQPLLTILPENSSLVAELFVPSRAAGFVKEGQDVRLLYAAFPYQRFGSYPAQITDVTRTILSPNEVNTPVQLSEPVYRVRAKLEQEVLEIAGEEIALQSGMQLEASIILEERSFWDWLLEPLSSVGGVV